MTIGTMLVSADSLPVMSEADAVATLRRERTVYNVPANWRSGDSDEVLVFTADPVEAVCCADVIARHDVGASYRAYVDGAFEVDGPIEVVLVGIAGTEYVDWRPAADVFTGPPVDDADRARRYALLMCRVRPSRPASHGPDRALVGAATRGRS